MAHIVAIVARYASTSLVIVFLSSSLAPAQDAPSAVNAPARFILRTHQIDVGVNGEWTATTHTELQILQQSSLSSLSQPAVNYSDALQELDVSEAYTQKAGGQKIPVTPDAIITQQSPVSARTPLLSDMKQKVIIFPNVEVGDTIVYTTVTHAKPQFAGNFTYDTVFPTTFSIDNETVTVTLPKSLVASIDEREVDARKTVRDGKIVYTLSYANQNPPPQGAQAVSSFDLAPRFSISTFKDYNSLANTYALMALPMVAVTPEIQQQADKITAGISDKREQAKRIYEWVATHVRYVALEFGEGSIVPHNANSVLANAYGDCKDHAVLFASLLRAKGIQSNLVLINGLNTYTIPTVATPAAFNHVITWLPELKLYADTTNGRGVPFGLLPSSEYGKQVVHIGDDSGALHRTPLSVAQDSVSTYKLNVTMDDVGHLTVEDSIGGTGNFILPLRALGTVLQGGNGTKLATAILQKSPTPRATGTLTAMPLTDEPLPYQISANYSTPGINQALAAGQPFEISGDNLRIIGPVNAAFFGPILDNRYKSADPVPCYSGHAIDDETLNFPATRHLDKLPSDTKLESPHITYFSHWSQNGNSVNVHREFDAHFAKALCSIAERGEMLSAVAKFRGDITTSVSVPRT